MKSVCVCAAIALTCGVARSQPCLPDSDGDGHPIFGDPHVMPWYFAQGENELTANVTDVVFADFDGDGILDAAAACNAGTSSAGSKYTVTEYVSVMKGHGDGTFAQPSFYDAGKEPCGIAAADFNGDGFPDLATANATGDKPGTVSVLLNKGDGTFWPDVEYAVGSQPRCVRAGDVNGDRRQDLLVLNVVTNDVSLLVGNGNGTFQPEVRLAVGGVTSRGESNLTFEYPGPFMALADMDGDKDLDVALPCGSKVKFLVNDGKGLFALSASAPSFSSGSVYDISAADLSGDGVLDLAAALKSGSTTPKVGVSLGLGNLGFAPSVGYDVATKESAFHHVTSVSAGDLDGDGDRDLAVGFGPSMISYSVLLRNTGSGAFAPKELLATSRDSWIVRWEEFNGDGEIDLAVVTGGNLGASARLCVLLNKGGTLLTFEPNRDSDGAVDFPWVLPYGVVAADFDEDGDEDVAVSNEAWSDKIGCVIVMLNDGSGDLGDGVGYPLGGPGLSSALDLEVGSLTSDALPDLVACTVDSSYKGPGRVHVLTNQGGGVMTLLASVELPGLLPLAAAVGDLDGDGDSDVLVLASEYLEPGVPKPRKLILLGNDGNGALTIADDTLLATMTWSSAGDVKLADLDDDDDLDVIACISADEPYEAGRMWVLRNNGAGILSIDQARDTPPTPTSLFAGDLDGDSAPDIALGQSYFFKAEPYLTVFKNDGNGLLVPWQTMTNDDQRWGRMIGADLDGDGDFDLAFSNGLTSILVHLNDGHGTFAPPVLYGVGFGAAKLAAADLDGDMRPEIVTANTSDKNVSVLRNRFCAKTCAADCDSSGSLDIDDFICFQSFFGLGDAKADCDSSGDLDIDDFICFQTAFGLGCP